MTGAPEAELRRIWTEVFERPIADDDDFFSDLDGDSLGALELIDRVSAELAVEVPVELLFDNPTLGGMQVALTSFLATTGGSTGD